ncbi:MAG: SUMF1/EgtB/PvdO family nonheme iron enzyme [Deltaproteobacteria bacterium]|nr:SUMF1/EgtB/PvdO family nonheme iron enzyme [Deltaproteobacteria bacterium]
MDSPDGFPSIGDKLSSRFRIVFGRGSGPIGTVYKALDLALDIPVAVKVFKPELFDSEFKDQNQLRLYRARAYQDPNLVKIYEVMEDGGLHFITCQMMEGMSLAAILDLHAESGEHFTIQKIRAILTRIMAGLEVIHAAGANHGNLKPQNIYVLPDRLALSDPYYLLSRQLQEGEEIPIEDYYRGPEQLSDPSLDLKETDIYSLALIAGELITGNPVQPGTPLSDQVPRLTGRMDDFFVKATATEPFERYRTLAEFGEALNDVLEQVETEGLWKRRYHETGSFRAIKVHAPEEDSGITPLPEQTGRPESEGPEVIEEAEAVEEAAEVEEVVEEAVTVEEAAGAEEVVEEAEAVEEAAEVEEVVEEATEDMVVEPDDSSDEEVLDEGIEVLPDDMPPPPPEAAEEEGRAEAKATVMGMPAVTKEDLQTDGASEFMTEVVEEEATIETPPMPPEALDEDGTLEVESLGHMAPFEKVEGVQTGAPPPQSSEPAPIRTFVLLFSLFVVVGGAAVLLYMKFSGPEEAVHAPPEPAKIEAPAQKPAPPKPVAAPVVVKDAGTVADHGNAATGDTPSEISTAPDPGAPVEAKTVVPKPEPPPRTLADMLRCPAGMAKVVIDAKMQDSPGADPNKAAFCMDAYEYPGMGKRPRTKVSISAAKALCKKAGKQLCSSARWKAACNRTYPYGNKFKAGACNVEGSIKESGSFPGCVTPSGIYDLVGNASEWLSDRKLHGGDTAGGEGNTCASQTKRFMPGPTNGFRCCADATR